MFGTKHNECVGFESRWKVKKASSESSTQTTGFAVSEKGTSTVSSTSTEVQTSATEAPAPKSAETDMQKLADWLNKLYPKVKGDIDNVNNSQAFKEYKLQGDSTEANCKLIQSIKVTDASGSGDKASRISAISWNQTGKSIAVTCNYDHHSWCYHTGYIWIYTLDREENLPDVPRKQLTTEGCITSLKFHPQHPAIIAAGTFSGGVVVWNVQNDDGDDIICTKNSHSEAVTQVSWINDVYSAKSVILATSGIDGLLKLWNFNLANNTLTIKANYKIKPPVLPSVRQKRHNSDYLEQKISRGIICFDFSHHVHDLFVVGTEGGLVVQCSVLGTNEMKGSTEEEPLLDPVYKYYEPHEGEICSVGISPNRNDMFMTSGTDGEIRMYLFGQESPAQIIFTRNPLNDLTFVLHEEKLAAGCGSSGILEIFHLISGKSIDNVTDEIFLKRVLTSLSINASKTNVVAVGNINGDLQLWNVPWHLFAEN